jgi:hypothetical protein
MQIDVESIKKLLIVSIIHDYRIEKKIALRKNISPFHLKQILIR